MFIKLFIYFIILMIIKKYNEKKDVNTIAKSGEYSKKRKYENVSMMKNSILSIITGLLVPTMIMGSYKGGIFNLNKFDECLVGKIIFTILSVITYYEIVQPYFGNRIFDF